MSRIRLSLVAQAGVLCLGLGSALAQQPAQPQPQPPAAPPAAAPAPLPFPILVVNMGSLLDNSKAAKAVRAQMETKRAEYEKEIAHQEEILKKERDNLQRQQASLSPEVLRTKGREFQQKLNQLDRDIQAKRQVFEKGRSLALQKIQETILQIVTRIAKQRHAKLVFQQGELLLYDQDFDVTAEVLEKLDEQLPTLTVTFDHPEPQKPEPPRAPAASEPEPPKHPKKK